jgi:hypothetical protein
MKYMLLICTDPSVTVQPEDAEDVEPWVQEMDGKGIRVQGSQLRPAAEAVTVRIRNGETLQTDGPFVETKEQMAGFDILECASMQEAIEVAAKHPMAKAGMVEVRQFWGE